MSKFATAPIGQKFHNWTVVGYSHSRLRTSGGKKETVHYWLCECECGTKRPVIASSLGMVKKVRPSRSCGCHKREVMLRDKTNVTHGLSKSEEFHSWNGMKQRCSNPNAQGYANYGGRGITVCARWLSSFENFLADMGPQPSPQHSVDRYPNVDGDYEPGNCRWATPKEQGRNKRETIRVEYQGQTLPLAEWCDRLSIPLNRTYSRLARGWTVEAAFTVPKLNQKRFKGTTTSNRRRLYA